VQNAYNDGGSMAEDARALVILQLLQDLPEGITITKCSGPKQPPTDAVWMDDPVYTQWLQALDKLLEPSQREGGLRNMTPPEFLPPPTEGPVWEVTYYDEYGSTFDDTHVVLAEDADLVRALLCAKNRLRVGRALGVG
jgi:hypothetical protein